MHVCALLRYVVNQELPRLDFFSSLDSVVLTSLLLVVVESVIVSAVWVWCREPKYVTRVLGTPPARPPQPPQRSWPASC